MSRRGLGDHVVHRGLFRALAVAVALAASNWACSGSPTSPQPDIPTSSSPPSPLALVQVHGTQSPPAVGESRQLAAAATFYDGSVYLVTTMASWTSSNPAIAMISSAGVVTGVGAGSTTITATWEGVSGSAAISIH